jgi:aminoglycoside phosphotransferase (APT) family kinase protein
MTEQLFGRIFKLGPTEVAFYRDVRPALPVRAPEAYSTRLGADGTYALLLEDLAASDVTFKTIADSVTLDEAKAVVDALAALHAAFWGERRFPWLRTAADNPNEAIERYVCTLAHRPTIDRFSDLLPERLRRGAERIHANRRALERYWANGPLTLIHGDSHIGNMYFPDGDAGLFDWQVTQHHQGVRDLAYFAVLSLDTEFRRAHEQELLDHYSRRLHDAGVPTSEAGPGWLFERYRSFSLYAYIGASVTATMSDLQPAPIARLGLRRAAVAVDDLDALHLLDRIANR